MLSIKTYLAVAAAIAATAFALAQWLPGMGAPFAILCTTLWVAYAYRRQRRFG
ncbi:MAG TPA: hypothetical protein VF655_00465 [Allosphingosinicella sp.]|jgi:CHASE2 domain-containing sensor protein